MNQKILARQIMNIAERDAKSAVGNAIKSNEKIALREWASEGGKRLLKTIDDATGNYASTGIGALKDTGAYQAMSDLMGRSESERAAAATRSVKIGNKEEQDAINKILLSERERIAEYQTKNAIIDEAGNITGSSLSKEELEVYKHYNNNLTKQMNSVSNGQVELSRGKIDKTMSYFGDKERGLARTGVTLGAYGALAVGTRYATGGTLTTNNRGESDIAGIPFI